MRLRLCYCGLLLLLLAWVPAGWAQYAGPKVVRIEIQHQGPPATSDELVRSNLRLKPGEPYLPAAVDDDVRNLYATGFFYNIQVAAEETQDGIVLIYKVQGKPSLIDIRFQGNTKFKSKKLLKKITSKVGDPLDEQKLFTDAQELQKLYQKKGYPRTTAKYILNIDEQAGRGTATFQIAESPKVKILEVDFIGAKAFPVKKLRRVIKTRKRWMFSWLTGSGYFKEDKYEADREKLTQFYRDKGYIDFEIKDVQFVNPTPRTMVIRFVIYEGTQYKVGSVKFAGNKLFSTPELVAGLQSLHERNRGTGSVGPNGLPMDAGDIFTPGGLAKDIEAVEDFYGTKGYIDVRSSSENLRVRKVPNTETGTMDLEFLVEEGQKSYIEKIEIKGNSRTKDKVIRRELAVSPGELFDMVRVKRSRVRLEGLDYFERVEMQPETTDLPNRKNLVVDVEEKQTGYASLGAGFSSVDSLVGIVEFNEGNFQCPWFRGGGQKLRLVATVGFERQDYEVIFTEPWFLGRKLTFTADFFYRTYSFLSPEDLYDLRRGGGRVSLERALGSDFLRGGVTMTLEDVDIDLTSEAVLPYTDPGPPPVLMPGNVPPDIRDETGGHVLARFGASLAYDTRNSVRLPDKGQRTSIEGEIVTLDEQFYRLELKSGWYFKGLAKGHVLELVGRTGVMQALDSSDDVPFFERHYLGGPWSLRGFDFREVSPRQPGYKEPVGGDTFWFGSAEYSIPIFEKEGGVGVRIALFYDIGSVGSSPYNFNVDNYSDNWGIGLRLNLPRPFGPMRLDYGIPITHDEYNNGSGEFHFSAGWTRQF
ncbi:MAG TPA: outer membrane protein assembly factor BamA [Candidatus Paceibacterota bacterium]|nr:outer membrane protein assembly factor BamA [Verrucomicrobiota bacterium]HSA11924.1 outer membrane protein assembly factor BamA [Candidatus Paceibacterota bacterium]